jgi:hypothetical protein
MKFEYSDLVRVVDEAPEDLRPGMMGSVCGIVVTDAKTAATFGVREGVAVYLIEFSDAETREVPENWLSRAMPRLGTDRQANG